MLRMTYIIKAHVYIDVGLLGCNTVWTCRAEALKMKTVCFSKMLVSTYKSTLYYNPEDMHQQPQKSW
jgi:hypothetical protein